MMIEAGDEKGPEHIGYKLVNLRRESCHQEDKI